MGWDFASYDATDQREIILTLEWLAGEKQGRTAAGKKGGGKPDGLLGRLLGSQAETRPLGDW